MVPKSWWLTGLAGLIILSILPFAGQVLRGDREDQCAWDGLRLEPIYQVRIVEETGSTANFCCLQCAERWLERHDGASVRVFVTDEASGAELDASRALYVRSSVVTNTVTGNRRHVFRRIEDASKHADAAHGRRLLGAERPFAKASGR
jgi:hypothetical protein